jgi:CRISPR-associated protein Csm5
LTYKLTALTPLLIGDGRELSPIDYMVWKDQVNVLDQTRIFKLLSRGPRLEGYLTQLRKATKLDFASWGGFAQNFSQRRIPFEAPEAATIWNSAPPESLFIPTFASNTSGAYVPGSAVKGALRTGFVFSRWSASTLERVAANLEGDRVPRRLAESSETSSGVSQVKIVSMADSQPAPVTAFRIYVTRVASLDTRQAGKPQLAWKVAGRGNVTPQRVADSTPVFAEMAIPGTEFAGRWDERTFFENAELSRALGWRSTPKLEAFVEAANDYADAQIALHEKYAETPGLGALADSVNRLKQDLAAARESRQSCLMCVGWGGGFVAKAGFLGTGDEPYKKILRAIPAFGKAIRDGVPFPKTRRIVFTGGQPAALAGWVRLDLRTSGAD